MNVEPPTLFEWGAIGASPLLASFIATASIRAARNEQWIAGRSHCDSCSTTLQAVDLVPIASAIMRSGRCRTCAAPIPSAHTLAEIALPVGAFLAACVANGAVFASLCGLLLLLLAASVYDVRTLRIPDMLTAPIALGGAAFAFAFYNDEAWLRMLAAAGFGALLLALALAYERLRGPGLGGGDVKLFAAAALWLPPWAIPWALASAALSALAWISTQRYSTTTQRRLIPFAPFLSLGLFISCCIWIAGVPPAKDSGVSMTSVGTGEIRRP